MAEAKAKKTTETAKRQFVGEGPFNATGTTVANVINSADAHQQDSQDPVLMSAAIQFSIALLTRHGVLKPTQVQINEAADAALMYARTIIAKVRGA